MHGWPSTMATGPEFCEVKSKQNRSGMHCIAPGCTNHFYKKQEKVHYHRLPVANKELLRKWLQKMKRANPPVNCNSRVCSNHFLPEDYVLTGYFNELGEYGEKRTNRLKPEAVPSVFDFSQYSRGETDCPSVIRSPNTSTARADRLNKRKQHQQQQEVRLISPQCLLIIK